METIYYYLRTLGKCRIQENSTCDFTETVIIYISTHDPPVFIHTFKNIVIIVLYTYICGLFDSLHIVTQLYFYVISQSLQSFTYLEYKYTILRDMLQSMGSQSQTHQLNSKITQLTVFLFIACSVSLYMWLCSVASVMSDSLQPY